MVDDLKVLHVADWVVETVPRFDAVHLIENLHYTQTVSGFGAVAIHGLRRTGLFTQVEGVTWWQPPMNGVARLLAGDDWEGVLNLTRLVVHPDVPKNGASYLLGHSMKLLDRERWPVLVTYADTRQGHTGGIYKATNWRSDGEVPAGGSWVGPNGEQRANKNGAVSYTRQEMEARGFTLLPTMPKIRFVHDVRSKIRERKWPVGRTGLDDGEELTLWG